MSLRSVSAGLPGLRLQELVERHASGQVVDDADEARHSVTSWLDRVLDQHAPFPAVVMNRHWDVVRVNAGASRLFADLYAPALLERARREAVGGVLDVATANLVHRMRTGADAKVLAGTPRSIAPLVPVIDVRFTYRDTTLSWFSLVSTVGTPIDITAQELRLEAFFPSDDDTAARWRDISATVLAP